MQKQKSMMAMHVYNTHPTLRRHPLSGSQTYSCYARDGISLEVMFKTDASMLISSLAFRLDRISFKMGAFITIQSLAFRFEDDLAYSSLIYSYSFSTEWLIFRESKDKECWFIWRTIAQITKGQANMALQYMVLNEKAVAVTPHATPTFYQKRRSSFTSSQARDSSVAPMIWSSWTRPTCHMGKAQTRRAAVAEGVTKKATAAIAKLLNKESPLTVRGQLGRRRVRMSRPRPLRRKQAHSSPPMASQQYSSFSSQQQEIKGATRRPQPNPSARLCTRSRHLLTSRGSSFLSSSAASLRKISTPSPVRSRALSRTLKRVRTDKPTNAQCSFSFSSQCSSIAKKKYHPSDRAPIACEMQPTLSQIFSLVAFCFGALMWRRQPFSTCSKTAKSSPSKGKKPREKQKAYVFVDPI